MFCYHFRYKLRVSAWAVGSCSIGPPAGGILEISIFQTLRLTGRIALYSLYLTLEKKLEDESNFLALVTLSELSAVKICDLNCTHR